MYATSIIMVLATPVVAITLALVAVERVFQLGIFDPALGGDPVLFQHMFWFYSHPAVYIMILPGMGVISELIPASRAKPSSAIQFVAFSSVAIAVFGFLVWGHHMFAAGNRFTPALVFSLLSFLVAIPSAIKVFNWTATLYKGSISYKTPMLYAFGFIGLFTHRRADRTVPGGAGTRHPRARHLLRRRALPLHHGGRHGHGVPGRAALLVAQDDRPNVPGERGRSCPR